MKMSSLRIPPSFLPAILLCCLMLALPACQPVQQTAGKPQPYLGETDSIDQVIARINANNAKLPTLWAHQDFEANIVPEKGKPAQYVNGYGTLLYSGGNMMRLTAKKEVTDLFDMGCDADRFWVRMVPGTDTFWWGNFKNVGQPCMQQIPIRPDEILEVLGIREIPTFLLQEPVPVMRFNNDLDCYVIDWQMRVPANIPNRWIAEREIWYDRIHALPTTVLLFDDKGRVVLRAFLSDYQAVKDENLPESQWPKMATRFKLFFPDTGSHLTFKLSDLTLSHNGFPKPISFRMPSPDDLSASGVKVIQIDADCGN